MTIQWKGGNTLGDERTDTQHQHLYKLASQILVTDDVSTVRGLALELYQHTRIHFEKEEGLMRQHGYPDLAAHIDMHNRLLGRLNVLSQDIGKGQLDKPALDALMADWVLFHIPLDDARFWAYLKSKA